jgi:hypothetical protein
MTPTNRDAILDRWAQRDAAKSIKADLGISSLKTLYRIIAEARAANDPRATYRSGRESANRPSMKRRDIERARRRRGRKLGNPSEAMAGWHFGKCTVFVTQLGTGSTDCLRIPVSVSCIPSRMPSLATESGSTGVLTGSRSLAEAMALHPLHGLSSGR